MAAKAMGAAEFVACRAFDSGLAVRVVSLPGGAGRLFTGLLDDSRGFGGSTDYPTLREALEALLEWPEGRQAPGAAPRRSACQASEGAVPG